MTTGGFALDDLGVRRDGVDILEAITITVPDTGITVIAGPSGSGKSSLLRLLNRLDDPTTGAIHYRGEPLVDLDPRQLRRRVAMVFQRPVVFDGTVLDNLQTVAPDLTEQQAADLLTSVAFDAALLDRDGAHLSGGEAQRLCLARALTTDPEVVLADEPTASIDTEARHQLEELALTLDDVGWIWVTHDIGQIERLAAHVIVVDGGRVTAAGSLAELREHTDPVVRRVVTEAAP